jgi:hypothetical protein
MDTHSGVGDLVASPEEEEQLLEVDLLGNIALSRALGGGALGDFLRGFLLSRHSGKIKNRVWYVCERERCDERKWTVDDGWRRDVKTWKEKGKNNTWRFIDAPSVRLPKS